MLRREIHEAEGAVAPVRQSLQHLVVLRAQLFGRGFIDERIAHEHADSFDAHSVGKAQEILHVLVRRGAGEPVDVIVKVPDHERCVKSSESTEGHQYFSMWEMMSAVPFS